MAGAIGVWRYNLAVEFRIPGPAESRGRRWNRVAGAEADRAARAAAAEPQQVVSTDRLIDDIWGERSPRTAQVAADVCLTAPTLGDEAIETRPPGYLLVSRT
jgi:hypothetical protein